MSLDHKIHVIVLAAFGLIILGTMFQSLPLAVAGIMCLGFVVGFLLYDIRNPIMDNIQDPIHIMVDIETLDTAPSAAILSIGAVAFRMPATYQELDLSNRFYADIDVNDSMRKGATASFSTIKWWTEQSDEARRATFARAVRRPEEAVLNDFITWVTQLGPIDKRIIWANGIDFDLTIIREAMRRNNITHPLWQHTKQRDYRTIRSLLQASVQPPPETGVRHDALEDAMYQATYLVKMLVREA